MENYTPPVTGNKFNRTAKGILMLFLIFTLVSFVAVAGNLSFKPSIPSLPVEEKRLTDLTPEVLSQATFDMPFLVSVLRANGSFSFARVENGVITSDRFVDQAELSYLNGEFWPNF